MTKFTASLEPSDVSFQSNKGSLQKNKPKMAFTVAIFRKWQDSSVALWIEIAVILKLRHSLEIWYGFVGLVWYGGGGLDD